MQPAWDQRSRARPASTGVRPLPPPLGAVPRLSQTSPERASAAAAAAGPSPSSSGGGGAAGAAGFAAAQLATVAAACAAAALAAAAPDIRAVPVLACATLACAALLPAAALLAASAGGPALAASAAAIGVALRARRAAVAAPAALTAVRTVAFLLAVYLIGPARTLVASGLGLTALPHVAAAYAGLLPLDRRRTLRTAFGAVLIVCVISYDASGGAAPSERATIVSRRVLETRAGHIVKAKWSTLTDRVRVSGIDPLTRMAAEHIRFPLHSPLRPPPLRRSRMPALPREPASGIRAAGEEVGRGKELGPMRRDGDSASLDLNRSGGRVANVEAAKAQALESAHRLLPVERDELNARSRMTQGQVADDAVHGQTDADSGLISSLTNSVSPRRRASTNSSDMVNGRALSHTAFVPAVVGVLMSSISFATSDIGMATSSGLTLDLRNSALAHALSIGGAVLGILPFAILSLASTLYVSSDIGSGNIVRVSISSRVPILSFFFIVVPRFVLANDCAWLGQGLQRSPDVSNRRDSKVELRDGFSVATNSFAGGRGGAKNARAEFLIRVIFYTVFGDVFGWLGYLFEPLSFTMWLACIATAGLLHIDTWTACEVHERLSPGIRSTRSIGSDYLPLLTPSAITSPSIPPSWRRQLSNLSKWMRSSAVQASALFLQTRPHRASSQVMSFLAFQMVMVTLETAYAFWTDSVGLISISADNLFCCLALAAGLFATRASASSMTSAQLSCGLARLESLCGFTNGLLLLAVALLIFLEAIDRTFNREHVDISRILAVCLCGIVGNGLGLLFFPPEIRRENHNVLAIYLHIFANTLAYVGIATSTLILGINPKWTAAELVVALFVAMVVVAVDVQLLVRSGRLLMNLPTAARAVDVQRVLKDLHQLEGVSFVEHFRVWHLNPTTVMASVHLGLSSSATVQDRDVLRLAREIFNSMGVPSTQVTIQVCRSEVED